MNNFIDITKKLYEKGFSPGTSGNVSVRDNDAILITHSGINIAETEDKNIVKVDFLGNSLSVGLIASSEKNMHIKIYEKRPDINAIIHVHSPKITAFAVIKEDVLNAPFLAESIIHLGYIAKAKYALPSSDELAQNVADCFKNSNVVLMQNHGVVVADKTLKEAYNRLETLEAYVDTYINAKLIGTLDELSMTHVEELNLLVNKMQNAV